MSVIAVLVIKRVSINWLPKALNIVGIQSESNLQMLHGTQCFHLVSKHWNDRWIADITRWTLRPSGISMDSRMFFRTRISPMSLKSWTTLVSSSLLSWSLQKYVDTTTLKCYQKSFLIFYWMLNLSAATRATCHLLPPFSLFVIELTRRMNLWSLLSLDHVFSRVTAVNSKLIMLCAWLWNTMRMWVDKRNVNTPYSFVYNLLSNFIYFV